MPPRPQSHPRTRRILRRAIPPLLLGLLTVPLAAFVGIMLFPNGQGLSSTTTPAAPATSPAAGRGTTPRSRAPRPTHT